MQTPQKLLALALGLAPTIALGCGQTASDPMNDDGGGAGGDAPLDGSLGGAGGALERSDFFDDPVMGGASSALEEAFPPDAEPYGVPHEKWVARWWQWYFSLPKANHPKFGGDCGLGQSGEVWFLMNSSNGEVAEWDCTVPDGTALFILATALPTWPQVDCLGCEGDETPDDWYGGIPATLAAMRDFIETDDPRVSIDGEVAGLDTEYRWSTDDSFLITAPDDESEWMDACLGPFKANECGWPQGDLRPMITVGYGVMIEPLPSGEHTVRFGAKSADGTWITDVTYNLTVE